MPANVAKRLIARTSFTLFLPSDTSFKDWIAAHQSYELSPDVLAQLLATVIVPRHMVASRTLFASDLPADDVVVQPLAGPAFSVRRTASGSLLVDKHIYSTHVDVAFGGGVIHVIDGVLDPGLPATRFFASVARDSTAERDQLATADSARRAVDGQTGARERLHEGHPQKASRAVDPAIPAVTPRHTSAPILQGPPAAFAAEAADDSSSAVVSATAAVFTQPQPSGDRGVAVSHAGPSVGGEAAIAHVITSATSAAEVVNFRRADVLDRLSTADALPDSAVTVPASQPATVAAPATARLAVSMNAAPEHLDQGGAEGGAGRLPAHADVQTTVSAPLSAAAASASERLLITPLMALARRSHPEAISSPVQPASGGRASAAVAQTSDSAARGDAKAALQISHGTGLQARVPFAEAKSGSSSTFRPTSPRVDDNLQQHSQSGMHSTGAKTATAQHGVGVVNSSHAHFNPSLATRPPAAEVLDPAIGGSRAPPDASNSPRPEGRHPVDSTTLAVKPADADGEGLAPMTPMRDPVQPGAAGVGSLGKSETDGGPSSLRRTAPSRAGDQPVQKNWTGDAASSADEADVALSCSGRGARQPNDPNRQEAVCDCAVLFHGPDCEAVRPVPGFPELATAFGGAFVWNQDHLRTQSDVRIVAPSKTYTILSSISDQVRANLTDVLPPHDPWRGKTHGSCALVGSSGVLLRFPHGPAIDAADLVVRFNAAPTAAYAKSVGARTDVRISNGEHLGWREGSEAVAHHLKAQSFLVKLLLWQAKYPGTAPLVFDPDFTQYVAALLPQHIASSGFVAVVLALHLCRNVTLYGFQASARYGARHHYFNLEAPANAGRDDSEFERLRALAAAGMLRFAEPCVLECHGAAADCDACLEASGASELLPLERWTPKQRAANKAHEIRWVERVKKWDAGLDRRWRFTEQDGLVAVV